jgi:hypothetical protein
MPKFILSDEPPQQSTPGRFVLSDAPPAADNRNMLEKAAQWASDTFGANGNLRGSAVGGVMQGMADPVAGLVQMGANLPGIKSLVGDSVNAGIAGNEAQYEAARQSAGRSGFDAARLVGNVAAPSNVIAAARVPMAATRVGQAGAGAAAGAIGAALTPEKDAQDFWSKKLQEGAVGGLAGAVLAPVAGAVGQKVSQMWNGRGTPPPPAGTPPGGWGPAIQVPPGSHSADASIAQAAAEAGQTIDEIPQSVLYQLRAQAEHALANNTTIDTAAALRKADFEALGQQPLLGQITRDPMQFARERNLRGIAGAGEPIAARLSGQTEGLNRALGGFANEADETYGAGARLAKDLGAFDARAKGAVDQAYDAARNEAGRYVDLDHVGFVQAANDALDAGQLGHYLPAQIRNLLNDVSTGAVPLNVNTAVQIDSVLSAAARGAQPAERMAINQVRSALSGAQPASSAGADALTAFSGARQMAAERFGLHRAIPALKAAADGTVPPDDFVKKFVLNGDVKELRAMADLLKKEAPESYNQARQQIGAELRRAGFGENVSGDKPFSQERFNQRMRQIGTARLQAFFSPEEISTLRTVGRVGAYMESPPAGSAVNFSNTGSAVANFVNAMPMPGIMRSVVGAARNAAQATRNAGDVRKAMQAAVPTAPAPMSPSRNAMLNELLLIGSAGAGASTR